MSALSIRLRRVSAGAAACAVAAATVLVSVPGAAEAASGRTINVYVTASHTVRMTTHMHPGVHRFLISSAHSAALQLVRPAPGYTKADAVRDANAGLGGQNVDVAALKRFERNMSLRGGVSSAPRHRGLMYVNLQRGTYWALDTNLEPLTAAKLLTIHVGGRQVAGNLHAPSTLRAIREHTWARFPRAIAHRGLLTFRNNAQDNHFVELDRLLPGKTVADFRRWVNKAKSGQNPGPPPVSSTGTLDTGVVSPGHAMTFRYHLRPGHYILTCFWPDADMGGEPHAFMGMFRAITLR